MTRFNPKGAAILVTGGTGFIGSALVAALVKAGARVRTLDNNSRGNANRLGEFASHVETVTGDIRNLDTVKSACLGMEAVIHLAYINGTQFFYEKPELILEVAVKGMMNVVDACRDQGVGQLILASSSEVYQAAPRIPTDETAPLSVPDVLNPRFSYGGGKIISELLTLNFGRRHFERAVVFRPHNVYGPDMGREHVIPQFALRLKHLGPPAGSQPIDFPIQGSGRETRSFIFIDDFVHGAMRVIEAGDHLNIYHIGTEDEVTIADLAQTVAKSMKRTIRIVPGTIAAGSTPRRCPSITKLRSLGFSPAVSLDEGVSRTAAWYELNG